MRTRSRIHVPRRWWAPLALVTALAATLLPSAPALSDTPPAGPHYTWSQTPSKVWLQRPDESFLRLKPWTYCWEAPPEEHGESVTVCADGIPPERDEMKRLPSASATRFWFGRPGWELKASFASLNSPDDESCRSHVAALRPRPRWFRLPRPERPGVYQVDMFGSGPEGDVFVTFKWRVGRWDSVNAC